MLANKNETDIWANQQTQNLSITIRNASVCKKFSIENVAAETDTV